MTQAIGPRLMHVGRGMIFYDHTKQAGPLARNGEEHWAGFLHHDLVATVPVWVELGSEILC